ncbi:MAG: hypothetical protein V7K62_04465 [Nostoc sp.]
MILRDFKTCVETLQFNVSTPRFIHLIQQRRFCNEYGEWVDTGRLILSHQLREDSFLTQLVAHSAILN